MVKSKPYQSVHVDLEPRSYDILVGSGLLGDAGAHLQPLLKRPRTVVVTDRHVADLHLKTLEKSLEDTNISYHTIVLEPGEQTKTFAQLEALLETLLKAGVERDDTIIAFGGGVIGDLTGFAAAILRRGIHFAQIPTTLLAQVDSSVGGKTGINTKQGKNLVGAFHQPRIVISDTDLLATLPARELAAGYAEIVKCALIQDKAFFEWLEGNGAQILSGNADKRIYAVVKSCRAKAAIVAEDERESGNRAVLNLGHTFGHALEAATGYSDRLVHGEAVSIGLCLAFALSQELGLCPEEDAARVKHHLTNMQMLTSISDIPGNLVGTDELLRHMAQDKKVVDGQTILVLARGIGQAVIKRDISRQTLETFLQRMGPKT